MKLCFPSKFPKYIKRKSDFEWWSITLCVPCMFKRTERDFGDSVEMWKITAPTNITFEQNDSWHRLEISLFGFGIAYARQWDY